MLRELREVFIDQVENTSPSEGAPDLTSLSGVGPEGEAEVDTSKGDPINASSSSEEDTESLGNQFHSSKVQFVDELDRL